MSSYSKYLIVRLALLAAGIAVFLLGNLVCHLTWLTAAGISITIIGLILVMQKGRTNQNYSYIYVLAVLFLIATIIMVLAGEHSLHRYFSTYLVAYFLINEIYEHRNTKLDYRQNVVMIILLGGFAISVADRVIARIA